MKRAHNSAVVTLLVSSALGLLVLMFPEVARGQTSDGERPRPDPGSPISPNISVTSGPNGVTIYIAVTQQTSGSSVPVSATGGSVSTGSQRSCTANAMNIGISLSPWFQSEAPNHPGETPWTVVCDDGFFAVVWVPIDAATGGNVEVMVTDGGVVDPVFVAHELLNHIPIPDIAIEANPATGLVALPSWFWIDGYDGAPIGSSGALPGVAVDVEVEPLAYRWSFGDGTTVETTSLGQRYPAESDIRHVYEQSSLTAGGAYSITVEVTFAARYRVNGGAWEALEPITRVFNDEYPVQQLQSVLTGQRQ